MYTKALDTSAEAFGTLQQQQDVYMESTAAKLQILETKWEKFYDTLIDEDEIRTGIESITTVVDLIEKLTASFGGGLINSIVGFGAILSSVFSQQISNGLIQASNNARILKQNLELLDKQKFFINSRIDERGGQATVEEKAALANFEAQQTIAGKILFYQRGLTTETQNQWRTLQKIVGAREEEAVKLDHQLEQQARKLQLSEEEITLLKNQQILPEMTSAAERNSARRAELEEALDEQRFANQDYANTKAAEIQEIETTINKNKQNLAVLQQVQNVVYRIAEGYNNWDRKDKSNILAFDSKAQGFTNLEQKINEIFTKEDELSQKIKQDLLEYVQNMDKSLHANSKRKYLEEAIQQILSEHNLSLEDIEATERRIDTQTKNLHNTAEKVKQTNAENNRILQQKEKETKEEVKELDKESKILSEMEQTYNRIYANKQQLNAARGQSKDLEDAARSGANLTQTIMGITGALGGLSSLWMSVNSLIRIWNDETTSASQKGAQLLMTLSMGIPLLINNYQKLGTGLKSLITVEQQEIITQNLSTLGKQKAAAAADLEAAQESKAIIVKKLDKALAQGRITQKGYEAAVTKLNTKIEEENGRVVEINNKIKQESIWQSEGNLVAKLKESIAVMKNTEAYEANKVAMAKNFLSVSAATAIFAAAAITIALMVHHFKELEKATVENAKAEIERTKALEEEYEASEKLYQEYQKVYKQYEEGTATKEQLKDATDKLAESYNIEGAALARLTGNYEAFNESLERQNEQKREDRLRNLKEEISNYAIQMASEGTGSMTVRGGSYTKNFQKYQNNRAYDNFFGRESIAKNSRLTMGSNYSNQNQVQLDLENNPSSIVQYYEDMRETINYMKEDIGENNWTNSEREFIRQLQTELTKLRSTYEEVKKDIEAVQDTVSEGIFSENFNEKEINNIQDVDAQVEKLKQALEEAKEQNEELYNINIDDVINEYLNSLNNEIVDVFLSKQGFLKQGLSDQIAQALAEGLQDNPNLLSAIEKYGWDLKDLTIDALNAIKEYAASEGYTISVPYEIVQNPRDNILANKNISKDDYDQMVQALNIQGQEVFKGLDYKAFNDMLSSEQLELIQQALDLQVQYNVENTKTIEEKKKINEELKNQQQAQIDSLEAQRGALILQRDSGELSHRDLHETLQSIDAIENELADLTEGKYKLEIEINEDDIVNTLESATNAQLNQMDTLRNMAELIGDNWQVAAENVKNFANAFPEIAAQAEVLEGGILQLPSEMVNSYLAANGQIINSNKEVLIEQIEDKRTILAAERDFLVKKINILEQELNGTISEQEAEDQIKEAAVEYAAALEETSLADEAAAMATAVGNATNMGKGFAEVLHQIDEKIVTLNNHFNSLGTGVEFEAMSGSIAGGKFSKAEHRRVLEDFKQELADTNKAQQDAARASVIEQLEAANDRLSVVDGEIARLTSAEAMLKSSYKNFNDASNRVQSGLAGKEGSSKGGGGGGGGNKDAKDEKKWEEEFEKWYEYEAAIELVEKELDRFQKKREKMAGSQLAKSLQNENKLLEEQANRIKLYNNALKEDTAKLRQQAIEAGYQFQFDSKGYIMNYVEETSRQVALMNAAIAAVNAGGSEEEYEAAEKRYEAFKKFVSQYDEQIKKIDELDDELEDIRKKELANNLEAWEIEIQVKLDLKEAKRDFNSWLKEMQEDFQKVYKDLGKNTDFYLKQISTFEGADGTVQVRLKAIQDVIEEIHKLENGEASSMFENMSQAQEKLKDLRDSLMDDIKDVHELLTEAWDDYLKAIDDAKNKMEDLNTVFENANDELEYYGQLIELLFGEEAYGKMASLYDGQIRVQKVQLDSMIQQRDMWKQLWEESGANFKNIRDWTEDQKKFYENWINAQKEVNDLAVDFVKTLQNDVTNSINDVAKRTQQMLYNGQNPDFMKQRFKDQLEWDEMVKDDTERIYEIQAYENKIDSLIQKNEGNVKNQEKLNKLKEDELKNLREKKDLTDHDIKMAELRLTLAEKQMALDDAQNAKNTMKLTRNEQGNWSYQYVANDEDIASKEQEVLEAYQQLYEEAKNNLEELEQDYYDFVDEFYSRLTQLEQDRLAGLISEQEYQQQRAYLEEWFAQRGEYYATQLSNAKTELATANTLLLKELYDQDVANYEEMTDAQKELVDDFTQTGIEDWFTLEEAIKDNTDNIGTYATDCMDTILPYWDDAATQMADKWNADDGASIKDQVKNAIDEIDDKFVDYKEQVDWLSDEIGIDFDNIEEHIDDTASSVEELADETKKYTEDSTREIRELKGVVDSLKDSFNALLNQALAALNAIEAELAKVGAAAEAAAQAIYLSQQMAADAATMAGNIGGGNGSGSGGGGGNIGGSSTSAQSDNKRYYHVVDTVSGEHLNSGKVMTKEEAEKVANIRNKMDPGAYIVSDITDKLSTADFASLAKGLPVYYYDANWNMSGTGNVSLKTSAAQAKANSTKFLAEMRAKEKEKQNSSYYSILSQSNTNDIELPNLLKQKKYTGTMPKLLQPKKYATGGYTGEWGSSGKLAVLHEKELVLNKEDTANILSAVDSMRKLNSSIGGSIMSQVLGTVLGLRNYHINTQTNATVPAPAQNTSNTYNIDRLEFPNVNDINTMVEALESLPLLASQYVNRSGR